MPADDDDVDDDADEDGEASHADAWPAG